MDSDEVSFAIKPTAKAGEPEELYADAWELLVATIKKNTKHASAAEVLRDYLFDTRADGEGASHEKAIRFVFLSPSSACDVQMAVAAHWFELAIAVAAKELAALATRHGFTMKAPSRAARALATAKRAMPFVGNGKTIVGVTPGKTPLVHVDNEGESPLEEAELTTAARKAVLDVAKSRLCACVFCETVRKGKATVAKLPAKKAKPEAAPAADGVPPKLQHFKNLAKAIKNAERCGSVEEGGYYSITVPDAIAKLRHVKVLRLGHLANLPAALFSLTTLEELSFGYGTVQGEQPELALPAAIGQLVNLKSLALPQTFTELPATLGDLVQLERLDLTSTSAREIPASIASLARLRSLALRSAGNLVKPLPDLGPLAELEHLDLSTIRRPEGVLAAIDFSRLKKLRELDLSGSTLAAFPATLRDLPALRKLGLSRAGLAELPATFATLVGLVELDAQRNAFERFPAALDGLPALASLDLARNKLADVSALTSLPALETLDLSFNPLERLPERAHLPKLKTLHIRGTGLARFPNWLAELPSLVTLSVGQMTALPPGECDALKKKRPGLGVFD